ncbi:MAG: helix-turn-helix domain-containing protein [Rhodospirillales bacterium]|nr:MAG: helix-turn-helix domain-containing protein [Rhodospirillales bacterium]
MSGDESLLSALELLTITDLAALLKRSEGTIRNDLIRNPSAVPPYICPPGTRCRRWRRADVMAWLNALPTAPVSAAAPHRGRPRKSA